MSVNDLNNYLRERDALFANPTLEAAEAHFRKHAQPVFTGPLTALAATHKARLQWIDATDDQLAESERWLIDNGFQTTMRGAPPLTPNQRDIERIQRGKRPLMGMK